MIEFTAAFRRRRYTSPAFPRSTALLPSSPFAGKKWPLVHFCDGPWRSKGTQKRRPQCPCRRFVTRTLCFATPICCAFFVGKMVLPEPVAFRTNEPPSQPARGEFLSLKKKKMQEGVQVSLVRLTDF